MPSEAYLHLLREMEDLHKRKSAGYAGSSPDPWINFRGSERIGVPAWKGALIRWMDKQARIMNLVENPANDQVNESLRDTLLDISAYSLIIVCLLDEISHDSRQEVQNEPSGGEAGTVRPVAGEGDGRGSVLVGSSRVDSGSVDSAGTGKGQRTDVHDVRDSGDSNRHWDHQ